MNVSEKRKIIEGEFGITYSEEIEGSVSEMCNVSQGILEQGIQQGEDRLANAIRAAQKEKFTTPEELIALGYQANTAKIAIEIVMEQNK